jgi:UDP-glucose 4-epimerase
VTSAMAVRSPGHRRGDPLRGPDRGPGFSGRAGGYYRANVTKSLDFAGHLLRNRCSRLIFSSSAAIYQVSEDLAVDEDSPVDPQSPYARTKAMCEEMFADIAAAHPIRVLSLRYFNPIGADPQMRTGQQLARPTHALGKMIQAHEQGVPFVVTGTDYPTRDGSGLRDYIHVWDLAAAHVAAGQVRRPPGAGRRHQLRDGPGHHRPGTSRRVQSRGQQPGRGARGRTLAG